MVEPLVSIGIPTYNRPDGLRRTLEHIIKQSYQNLEIIVSDNASPNSEVEAVAKEFLQKDSRIKYFRQDKNEGASFNFMFVLEKSTANYFMWAADDDYLMSENLIEKMVEESGDNILVFPNFNLFDTDGKIISRSILNQSYRNCNSSYDYLFAWCKCDGGYPVYGLYNLTEFYANGLSFEFDNHLIYYSEGVFLQKVYSTGKVKYIPDIFTNSTEGSSLPANKLKLLEDFIWYTKKTFLLYINSDKSLQVVNFILFINIVGAHSVGAFAHLMTLLKIKNQRKDLIEHQVMLDQLFIFLIISAPFYLPIHYWRKLNKYIYQRKTRQITTAQK